MVKKLTQEEFEQNVYKVFGDTYDLSKAKYENSATKVLVICKEHGEFYSRPNSLQQGTGCPVCGNLKFSKAQTKTQEKFLEDMRRIHGDVYDFSNSLYVNSKNKVSFVCKKHGVVENLASKLQQGRGCPDCGLERISTSQQTTKEDYLNRANSKFNSRFKYNLETYNGMTSDVGVECPAHGNFIQNAFTHLSSKHGCPKCADASTANARTSSTQEFIFKATLIHGDKYTYTRVKYISAKDKVEIICNRCDNCFDQSPDCHLRGNGCPYCNSTGYSKGRSGNFYILASGDVTKVGITNLNVNQRLCSINNSSGLSFTPVFSQFYREGWIPKRIEISILKWLGARYAKVSSKFDGSTECFEKVDRQELINYVLQLDSEYRANREYSQI